VPLTRAWAIILAFLATACLAGMFLLSGSSGGGFTDADRAAVRAVTEAGVAALQAQLQASPVQQVSLLRQDARLKDLLLAEPDKDDPEALEAKIYDALAEVTEETRVRTGSNLTVALIDANGSIMAASGAAEKELPELVASTAFQEAPADADTLFSITLADKLHVANVTAPNPKGRRLVALETLETGAGSLLRRVLGSETPAALVRKGAILGDMIGDQPVSEELLKLAKERHRDAPNEGASTVFTVGDGMASRIGALGRIPGPAGQGDSGAMLVVISAHTAAAGQRDMGQAIAYARESGTSLPWPILVVILLVTMGLAFYLPGLEGLTPMRRLGREFTAIAQGTQHSIFHDRYSGTAGEVARAAAAAHEALRQAYLAELEIEEEEEVAEEPASDPRSRPRTRGSRRVTRSHRNVPDATTRGSRAQRSLSGRDEGSGMRAAPVEPDEPDEPDELDEAEEMDEVDEPAYTPAPARGARGAARGTPGRSTPAPSPAVPARSTPKPSPAVPARSTPKPSPAVPTFAPAPRPAPSPAVPARAAPAPTPARAPSVAPAPAPSAADPRDEYYRSVYEDFLRVKTQCGEPVDKLTFDKFVQKLAKNAADIKKKKPDVDDVQFSVYVKDGKAALKAKIVKA
jgi:hypothetical protein